jgi:hypothetical protein
MYCRSYNYQSDRDHDELHMCRFEFYSVYGGANYTPVVGGSGGYGAHRSCSCTHAEIPNRKCHQVTQTCHNLTQNCYNLTRNCNPRNVFEERVLSYNDLLQVIYRNKRSVTGEATGLCIETTSLSISGSNSSCCISAHDISKRCPEVIQMFTQNCHNLTRNCNPGYEVSTIRFAFIRGACANFLRAY